MYTASSILAKAIKEQIPTRHDGRTRIGAKYTKKGRRKSGRYYFTDREDYRKEYLKSDHWKELRKEKLKNNPICQDCGNENNLDVHHLVYKQLYNVKIKDLRTLCRPCHNKRHNFNSELNKAKKSKKKKKRTKDKKKKPNSCKGFSHLSKPKRIKLLNYILDHRKEVKISEEELLRVINKLKQ